MHAHIAAAGILGRAGERRMHGWAGWLGGRRRHGWAAVVITTRYIYIWDSTVYLYTGCYSRAANIPYYLI